MTVLREVLARFGVEVDQTPLAGLSGGIDGVVGKLRTLGATLAAGLAVNLLRDFVTEMADAGDEIAETSARLGMSSDALQQWRHAATMNGVAAGELDAAMTSLFRNLEGATQGGAGQAQLFSRLGVNVRDAEGNVRSLDSLLPDIADGFAAIPNQTQQAGLALRLFGRAGARLVPLLSQGSAGVAALREEFQRLGGGASTEMVEQSAAFNDEMDRLDLAVFSLKSRLAVVLLPALTRTVEVVTAAASAFLAMAENSHLVEAALLVLGVLALAFGVKFLIGFAGPIAITLAVAAAIAFLILLVDDLITLFSGGKSVIGGFIDEMFGIGTAATLVRDLKDAWEGMILAVRRANFAVREFFGMTAEGEEEPQGPGARAENLSPAEALERRAREGARNGQIISNPGEDPAAARERFLRHRRELLESGQVEATQFDVEDGLARRTGRQARAGRAGGGREARIQARGEGRQSNVDARTQATIQVAPGTDRRQLEALRRAVGEVMDQRNREAVAALAEESVGEEE
jgi:TM2 domain-containing membrane protein YozV